MRGVARVQRTREVGIIALEVRVLADKVAHLVQVAQRFAIGLVDVSAIRGAVAGRHRSAASEGRIAGSIPPGLSSVAILSGLAALPLSLPLSLLPALSLLSLPRLLSSLLRLAGLLPVTGLLSISVLIPALQRIGLPALPLPRLVALTLLAFGQLLHAASHGFHAS